MITSPEVLAKDILERPKYHIRRFVDDFGDVSGKKILNPLGSFGKKACALGVLGAHVTMVDLSHENIKYAQELCQHAKVEAKLVVSDFLSYKEGASSYDMVFLDGGILHYFEEMTIFAAHVKSFLKDGGKLILNDFHPLRKLFKEKDIFVEKKGDILIDGDYFEGGLHEAPVSYEKFFAEEDQVDFPKCQLRYHTLAEIINAFAINGMTIERLDELPRYDEHQHIPGNFTLIVKK